MSSLVLAKADRGWLWAALLGALIACSWRVLGANFRYEVEIRAPGPYDGLLQSNLEIVKRRESPYMDADQLHRIFQQTPSEIKQLLATEGYFSPNIRSSLDERGAVPIARFTVEPGEPSRIGNVDLRFTGGLAEGDPDGSARIAKLRQEWKLPRGMVFRQAAWNDAKLALLQGVAEERYAAARITESEALVDPAQRSVTLKVDVDSGPPFTLGELEISGLKRYPRGIVETLNTIRPGTPYKLGRVLSLQTRLQNSGYFSTAFVTVDKDPAHPNQVPIRVTVEEISQYKIGFGIGYSTDAGPRGEINFQDNNFRNRGWRVTGKVKADRLNQTASTDLSLPVTVDGYQDSVGLLGERTDNQGEKTRKFGVGVKRTRVRRRVETTLALNYLNERQEIAGNGIETNRALAPGYSWTARETDHLLYPSRGYLLNLQLGAATKAILSDQNFVRGYGKLVTFHPVGGRGTLILRAEIGAVAARSRLGIPTPYLFRTGGDQSVRGYAYQSLGVPVGQAIVGGRYLAVASIEYVHRLTEQWGAAVFYDAGDATDSRSDFVWAQGYGIGARWRSPVGPINLDLAYGQRTHQVRVHFSLGFAF